MISQNPRGWKEVFEEIRTFPFVKGLPEWKEFGGVISSGL